MRFLAGLKTHSRRPVYTPPGSAQHTIPKLVVSRRALALKGPGTSFFFVGSRKSAYLLPRTTRPGPRVRTACQSLLSASRCRETRVAQPGRPQYAGPAAPNPGRAQHACRPRPTRSRSICGLAGSDLVALDVQTGRVGPRRARCAGLAALDLVALSVWDWPHWTWSRSACGTGRACVVERARGTRRRTRRERSQASRSGRQRVGTDRRSVRGVQGE